MLPIKYLKGDILQANREGPIIIPHCCNDEGKWGRGFVVPLARKWPITKTEYRKWFLNEGVTPKPFALGEVQLVPVEDNTWVANLIGQRGIKYKDNPTPVRYEALAKGFEFISNFALYKKAEIHTIRLGCGLAGGEWEIVEQLLKDHFCAKDIQVTIFDLEKK